MNAVVGVHQFVVGGGNNDPLAHKDEGLNNLNN